MMLFLRINLAGVVGLLAGGGFGWGLSMLLITTFSDVLGPRYSEFDMFGVIGAAFFGAVVSCAAAAILATLVALRSMPTGLHLVAICIAIVIPDILLFGLTLVIDGEWAWFLVMYLAICAGTLTGIVASLLVPIRPKEKSP